MLNLIGAPELTRNSCAFLFSVITTIFPAFLLLGDKNFNELFSLSTRFRVLRGVEAI